jgi:PAS domain S-box-containing protein
MIINNSSLKKLNYSSIIIPSIMILIMIIASFYFNFLVFHFFAEFFAVFVALCIGLIAYYTYKFTKNDYLLYIGLGYVGIGLLDLLHTLTFPGMNLFVIDGSNTTLSIWVLTRLAEAILLLSAPFFKIKDFNIYKVIGLFSLIFISIIAISLNNPMLLFIKGEGLTSLKTNFEYLIIFILLIALFINMYYKSKFSRKVYTSIQYAIILTIAAEYVFTLYTVMYGFMILLGHVLKFLSFWIIFKSLIKISLTKPMELLAKEISSYDAVPVSSVIVSTDGIIRQANQTALSETNLGFEQVIGKHNHDFFHPSYIQKDKCIICTAIKNQEKIDKYELYDKEKNKYFQYSLTSMESGSEAIGMIQVCIDITEIEKAKNEIEKFNSQLQEKIYERTEELEESNEELQASINNLKVTQDKLIEAEKMAGLGGLVAGVAHEINTPVGIGLTGISHFSFITEEIEEKYKNEEMTEDDFKDYIDVTKKLATTINTNLYRTSEIIKNFKQVAVDQTSELKREFNVKEYTSGIIISIDNIIKKKDISIFINCQSDLNIDSYPGAYAQIITNLIINSIKHGFVNKNKGTISVDIQIVEDKIELIYKDDGKGIKKEDLEKIYEPFFTTNRQAGGTGLGMNIIYNLVNKTFSGSISCKSKENEGVEFKILIAI